MNNRVPFFKLIVFAFVAAGFMLIGLAQSNTVWAGDETQIHLGVGTITKIDTVANKITFSHGAIKSLDWPSMTMAFMVEEQKHFENIAQGNKVEFEFVHLGNNYIIKNIKKL